MGIGTQGWSQSNSNLTIDLTCCWCEIIILEVLTLRQITQSHDRLMSERRPEKRGKTTHQNKMSRGSTWGEEETKCLTDI